MILGRYEIHMIHAGEYRLDGGAMFGVVPQVLWKKNCPPDEKNRIRMSLNTLLLVGDGRVILIDTGVGYKISEKFKEIYAVDYSRHHLLKSLLALNITPEDVTDVVLTHLHFDHVGGATIEEEGELKLQFPHATYYVQKKQLEWSKKKFEKDRASYLTENIDPLVSSNQLKVLNGEVELFKDVQILLSDGHTIAQQTVLIHGEGKKLWYAADLIPMRAHVPIPWVMAYDLAPAKTIEEKKRFLKTAAEEKWMVFFEHDPQIYCSYVEEGPRDYQAAGEIRF
ncbi:MAG: MBL fold metallo-hydrolase [Calditrichia bacterium]